ncbi:MAG: hypothetical protein Q9M89_04710 [Persephonella sp.]|nr:hypothetical protein [Persephonella sp.]
MQNFTWIGYLYSYWFLNTFLAQNLREDTVTDKKLNVLDDYILNFYIDNITGNLTIDACESDATGNPTTNCISKSIDELNALWEAGEKLRNTDPRQRKIYVPCDAGCGSTKLVEFSTDPTKKAVFETF